MAHLWQQNDAQEWHPNSLTASVQSLLEAFAPDAHSTVAVAADDDGGDDDGRSSGPLLCRCGENGSQWAVVAPAGSSVRVNGQAVSIGLRVLHDRDEVLVHRDGEEPSRWYFSTERLARVELYPAEKKLPCPRCKMPIEKEMPAVRCPDCGAWHHQIPAGHPQHNERECWTYSDRCSLCPQPTALGTGYRWTPETL